MSNVPKNVHALILGLSEDLAGELFAPLKSCQVNVKAVERLHDVAQSSADIIFCGANRNLVSELRSVKPDVSIVVVSRLPEVSDWLDSIEAGATDYCAAPFENSQVKWIVESSMRTAAGAGSHATVN